MKKTLFLVISCVLFASNLLNAQVVSNSIVKLNQLYKQQLIIKIKSFKDGNTAIADEEIRYQIDSLVRLCFDEDSQMVFDIKNQKKEDGKKSRIFITYIKTDSLFFKEVLKIYKNSFKHLLPQNLTEIGLTGYLQAEQKNRQIAVDMLVEGLNKDAIKLIKRFSRQIKISRV